MIPVALGHGEGADFRAPLGRAIIGGVITSTLLTLLVIPTFTTSFGWRDAELFAQSVAVPGSARGVSRADVAPGLTPRTLDPERSATYPSCPASRRCPVAGWEAP